MPSHTTDTGYTFNWIDERLICDKKSYNIRLETIQKNIEVGCEFIGFQGTTVDDYAKAHLVFKDQRGVYYVGPTMSNFQKRGYKMRRPGNAPLSLVLYYLKNDVPVFMSGNVTIYEDDMDKIVTSEYVPNIVCEHGKTTNAKNSIDKWFSNRDHPPCVCNATIKFVYNDDSIIRTPIGEVIMRDGLQYIGMKRKIESLESISGYEEIFGFSHTSVMAIQDSNIGIKGIVPIFIKEGIFYIGSAYQSGNFSFDSRIQWNNLELYQMYYYISELSKLFVNEIDAYFCIDTEIKGLETIVTIKRNGFKPEPTTIGALIHRNFIGNEDRYQRTSIANRLSESEMHLKVFHSNKKLIAFYETFFDENGFRKPVGDFLCLKHNLRFPAHWTNGSRGIECCPLCVQELPIDSKKINLSLIPYLKEKGFTNIITQFKFNDLPNAKFDIHTEYKNRKIIIEFDTDYHYNPTSYYHKPDTVEKDRRKTEYMKLKEGYDFIRIKDDNTHIVQIDMLIEHLSFDKKVVIIYSEIL